MSDLLKKAAACAARIESLIGVIESGLFIELATEIFVAEAMGVRVVSFPASGLEFQ